MAPLDTRKVHKVIHENGAFYCPKSKALQVIKLYSNTKKLIILIGKTSEN
jgi:hypothetical protein